MNRTNKVLAGAVSASLLAAAMHLEGTHLTSYEDVVGVWTICTGHTGPDVHSHETYTPEQCNEILTRELASHGRSVIRCVNVPINRNEYDAYTLFSYNVGDEAFCRSSLLVRLNAGDHTGACNGLLAWDVAGGRHLPGLHNRRMFERELCLRPVGEGELK